MLGTAPPQFTGDDLALAVAAMLVLTCAAWLALTALACFVAQARGKHRLALRIAGFGPPVARRILQAALVSAVTLSPATANAAVPPAPITLHVGNDGHLTTVPVTEAPVVRTPPTSTSTSTPASLPTTTTTAPATQPAATPPTTPPRVAPVPPDAPNSPAVPSPVPRRPSASVAPVASTGDRTHVVRAGDNLWRIAAAELARVRGNAVGEPDVARYWQRVIAANRATLRSGDPSLIFPGEIVTLPLD